MPLSSRKEKGRILAQGYNSCLQKWDLDFNPSQQKTTTTQVWVRLYNLPWAYWHPQIRLDLACGIGEPLHINTFTLLGNFGYFAHFLIDVHGTLPESLAFERDNMLHFSFARLWTLGIWPLIVIPWNELRKFFRNKWSNLWLNKFIKPKHRDKIYFCDQEYGFGY